MQAGIRVVQYGYAGAEGADVAEVVDRAQAEIYDVTDNRGSQDYTLLGDLPQDTMDEIDAIHSGSGRTHSVPTGFVELDEVTTGLHGGQMIIVAGRPGQGKTALATRHYAILLHQTWYGQRHLQPGDEQIRNRERLIRAKARRLKHKGRVMGLLCGASCAAR